MTKGDAMNNQNTPPGRISRTMRLLTAAILTITGVINLSAQVDSRIISRPLTPQEISNYGLPSTTQTSGGLNNVGIGAPIYVEAQVPLGTVITNILWSISSGPTGSAATLAASSLATNVPIYNPGDRSVFAVAGRITLVPDLVGQYTVNATISTNGGSFQLSKLFVGATNIGAGKQGLAFHDPPQCTLCHPQQATSWQGTKHATAMTRKIDGVGETNSHFNSNCLKCHNTGFDATPAADNGGFDDVARLINWIFPTNITAGNWAAMPQALKDVSNVQCESCHGPGDQHARSGGNPLLISRSTSSGDCGQCHDAPPYHTKNAQWNLSRHAVTTRYPTGEKRSACVGCHSGVGFIDRLAGKPENERRTDYEAIVCATCHDPHGSVTVTMTNSIPGGGTVVTNVPTPHQLRFATVTLMNGTQVVGGPNDNKAGKGAVCMNCHIARRDAESYVLSTSGSSRFGPHYGPQTDMLVGTNAVQYGRAIPSSAHMVAVPDTCVTCHMQATPASGSPGHNMTGGHTFKPDFDNGTPNDPSDDVHLTTACASCHGAMATFDLPRQDYDGNGTIEGVQTEVKGLLNKLGMLLPPVNSINVAVTSSYTTQQLKAAYNYQFVLEDKSFGIHNTSYAVNILKASMADLTGDGTIIGDADNDCLPDAWELQYFGSLTAQNANGDSDGDGLSNVMEQALGTNPTLADSDGDGFSDFQELHVGTSPTNNADNPQVGRSSIYQAAEMLFITEVGKTYQIQSIPELGTLQAWQNVGTPITGTGQTIQHFVSTRVTDKAFYRVIQVQP